MFFRKVGAVLLSILIPATTVLIPSGQAYAQAADSTWLTVLTPSSRFGQVVDSYQAPQSRGLVVFIEDLHFNRSVERTQVGLLRFYTQRFPTAPIGVEGAAGPLDYSLLSKLYPASAKNKLVNYLIENGEVTGPEAYVMLENQPTRLTGIENERYYQYHLQLFRDSYASRMELERSVTDLRSQLTALRRELRRSDTDLKSRVDDASARLHGIEELLAERVTLDEARTISRDLSQTLTLLQHLQSTLSTSISLNQAEIQDAVQASIDFYAAALLRDEPIAENTQRLLAHQPVAFLVAGGFHVPGVTEALKKAGVSYVVVMPNLKEQTPKDDALYVRRLLGGHVGEDDRETPALEDTLGKTGDILTPAGQQVIKNAPRPYTFSELKRIVNVARSKNKRSKAQIRKLARDWYPSFFRRDPRSHSSEVLGPTSSHVGFFSLVFAAFKVLRNRITAIFGNRRANDELTPEQWKRVEEVAKNLSLNEADTMYEAEMWRQRLYPDPNRKPLRIGSDEKKGENFLLAAGLNGMLREQWLGSVPYDELVKDPTNAEAAKHVDITLNSLDGGIGENVGRLLWLQNRAREMAIAKNEDPDVAAAAVRMGAKGTDLGFDIKDARNRDIFISISEAKLLQLIAMAAKKTFAHISFQPLVNAQSKASYDQLLAKHVKTYQKRTYREALEKEGITLLDMLSQSDLPGFDKESGEIADSDSMPRQPGGHGQWGAAFLWNIFRTTPPNDHRTHIRIFGNGDNIQNPVDESIAGYMRRNNIAMIKLTTAATPIDKKGGKDGVRVVHVHGRAEPVYVPDQMELADAKASGQVDLFQNAGQFGDEKGKQPFNTNLIYFNEDLLHSILKDLAEIVGAKEVGRIISPTRIDKASKVVDGKEVQPVDSAIGSAIHNLNAYFQMSDDSRIHEVLAKYNVDSEHPGDRRLLRFVDVPRDRFFTPVKSTFDIWWQRNSDFYKFDTDLNTLVPVKPGQAPPEVLLVGNDAKDPYWNELAHLDDSLGNASTRDLTSLSVEGQVRIPRNTKLVGTVKISEKIGVKVDLGGEKYRALLKSAFANSRGQLTLENVAITFENHGTLLDLASLAPEPPVTYRWSHIRNAFLLSLGLIGTLAAFYIAGYGGLSLKIAFPVFGLITIVSVAKLVYASWFRQSDDSIPLETYDRTTGLVTGMTGLVPFAHTYRSHVFFRNEFFANTMDMITIPWEAAETFVATIIRWFFPQLLINRDDLMNRPLVKALLSNPAKPDHPVYLPPIPSKVSERLQRVFGFHPVEKAFLKHAREEIASAA